MGQKVIETRRRLVDTWPETPEYRIGLANTLTAVALAHFRQQQIARAIESQKVLLPSRRLWSQNIRIRPFM